VVKTRTEGVTLKKIKSQQVYDAKVFQVSKVTLDRNGEEVIHSVVNFPGTICVLPITQNGKILLEKQYRTPADRFLIEIPAGKMDKNEKPEATMLRELEEETGFKAIRYKKCYEAFTSCGCLDEYLHYFIAEVEKMDENDRKLFPDTHEDIELFEVTVEQALELVKSWEIVDAKTIMMINAYAAGQIGLE